MYHINNKGEPGVCRAKVNCPFGGEKDHFKSEEMARKVYEERMNREAVISFSSREKKSLSERLTEIRRELEIILITKDFKSAFFFKEEINDIAKTLNESKLKSRLENVSYLLSKGGITKALEELQSEIFVNAEIIEAEELISNNSPLTFEKAIKLLEEHESVQLADSLRDFYYAERRRLIRETETAMNLPLDFVRINEIALKNEDDRINNRRLYQKINDTIYNGNTKYLIEFDESLTSISLEEAREEVNVSYDLIEIANEVGYTEYTKSGPVDRWLTIKSSEGSGKEKDFFNEDSEELQKNVKFQKDGTGNIIAIKEMTDGLAKIRTIYRPIK